MNVMMCLLIVRTVVLVLLSMMYCYFSSAYVGIHATFPLCRFCWDAGVSSSNPFSSYIVR